MYSVFLVEDEIAIREGLKTGFPWDQYGFAFVGDAEDGEMALPLILQTKPDVLITGLSFFSQYLDLSKLEKINNRNCFIRKSTLQLKGTFFDEKKLLVSFSFFV